MTSQRLFVTSDEPIEVVRDGLTRRNLAQTPTLKLVQWFREPGPASDAHTHDTSQVNFIVSGRYRVRVGGHEQELGPGDSFAALAGTPHSIECVEAGTYIAVKSTSVAGSSTAADQHSGADHSGADHTAATDHAHGSGHSHGSG